MHHEHPLIRAAAALCASLVLACWASSASAQADPASEIARGHRAGTECLARLPPLALKPCFDGVLAKDWFTHPKSAAFEIGLGYRYWEVADMQAQVYGGELAELTTGLANAACLSVARQMQAAGVTNAQLDQALDRGRINTLRAWRRCIGPDLAARP